MITLGENAFDAERETFLAVDTNSEKKPLHKQGKTNGQLNSPDSQVSQPDAVEQGIIQLIIQTAEQTRTALSQHFVSFSERLMPIVQTWDPQALIAKIQQIPRGAEGTLNNILSKFETDSAILVPKWQNAKQDYNDFRTNNNLVRNPDYLALKSIILWFSVLIILEAALNATLLWELTGILAAFGQTALITAVNVLFGAALTGLFFRYKNHVSWKIRWRILICLPVVSAVLVFNFGVGHYRDALVETIAQGEQLLTPLNWDDANVAESVEIIIDHTKKAMESVIASPFGIESILSALLIIVGIGFFGFATHKWYSMLDPYPGYRKRDLVLKNTHKDYKNLVETNHNKIYQEIKDVSGRASDERTKITNMRAEHNNLSNRAETLRRNYADWIVVLGTTQNLLLAVYRDSNRQNRNEPDPSHFNNEMPIDNTLIEPPPFDPPDLQNVDEVIEVVRKAELQIQTTKDQIWQQFELIKNAI